MENETKVIESLFSTTTEYGKVSFELIKLKAVDKAADVISSFIVRTTVLILATCFVLFLSLGLANWLGVLLGSIYYGYFAVAGLYGFLGLFLHLFMHNWVKNMVGNYIIKLVLK